MKPTIEVPPYRGAIIACGIQVEKLIEEHKADHSVVTDEMVGREAKRLCNIFYKAAGQECNQVLEDDFYSLGKEELRNIWRAVASAALTK